jgi:hypothetical protein
MSLLTEDRDCSEIDRAALTLCVSLFNSSWDRAKYEIRFERSDQIKWEERARRVSPAPAGVFETLY